MTIPSGNSLNKNLCNFFGYVNGQEFTDLVIESGGRLSLTVSPLPWGPGLMQAFIDQGLVSIPQGEFDLKMTCTLPPEGVTREAVKPLTGDLERENMILRASAAGLVPQDKMPKNDALIG